jgi:formate dehydrogenase assembly factor FdhD
MSLNENLIPLEAYLLLRSDRVSFELVPKAVMASVPILAAVGAPSFLAIDSLMAHPGFRGATRSSINDPSNALPRLLT